MLHPSVDEEQPSRREVEAPAVRYDRGAPFGDKGNLVAVGGMGSEGLALRNRAVSRPVGSGMEHRLRGSLDGQLTEAVLEKLVCPAHLRFP